MPGTPRKEVIVMESNVNALQLLEESEPELALFPCCGTCIE
jgi:hypothetical protein